MKFKHIAIAVMLIPPAIATGIALLFMAYVLWPLALVSMVGFIIYQAIKAYDN